MANSDVVSNMSTGPDFAVNAGATNDSGHGVAWAMAGIAAVALTGWGLWSLFGKKT